MNNNNAYYKYVFKYIIVGNASVGKSCILNQFLNNRFTDEYEITVGVEFGGKTIQLQDNSKIKLQIWDTAGQENFKAITRAYYRSAAIALVVYDITSRESFDQVESWLEECKINGNQEMTIILVGNKIDLESERVVSFEEGKQFAEKNSMMFFECSAKQGKNINDIFVQSAERVYGRILSGAIDIKNENFGIKPGTEY